MCIYVGVTYCVNICQVLSVVSPLVFLLTLSVFGMKLTKGPSSLVALSQKVCFSVPNW